MPAATVFACAALLDRLVGDPPQLLHPVQVMGAAISAWERLVLPRVKGAWGRKLAGIALTVGLAGGTAVGCRMVLDALGALHVWVAAVVEVVLLASCFAGRSLGDAAREVLAPLTASDLAAARTALSRYVGRDTTDLDEAGVLRAVLETVAENTTDAVIAPILYALLGGAPLALAFKAVSTLDSMIGYRVEPYTHFGWCAARTDDLANWLPARLTALTVAVLSGEPGRVIAIVRRDGPADPSPNSGVSIAAFAAALGVRLGGENRYQGQIKRKPLMGEPVRPLTAATVNAGVRLMDRTALVWTVAGGALLLLLEIGRG
jgi:adenosylcobinamide-phosphate synthase